MVEWQIGPKLRQVPGVIEVVGFGGALKQYRVTLDPARLAAHGVSIADGEGGDLEGQPRRAAAATSSRPASRSFSAATPASEASRTSPPPSCAPTRAACPCASVSSARSTPGPRCAKGR